ncbi:hypothetical protein PM3016_6602 [Paenibacillus mucilaginosus 3016]|uniref:Uncharacterized protein n=2 Tax=Paenibacillus mucilaginosus TaxID=61624 RepID=H6NKT0_9BACL|nr:hypothetical protein PM3016_6602 [Paenibacillus mucilaginosus 3016]AFH65533.1 hypothetical protein B2K_33355 [Paenibacillus mucilaginosus K02]WFA21649.1 hypothetical protein ERY13_32815 [Paenibacillus mucilaginosus]
MVAVLYSLLWILAAFRWADRNWERYYPTLLFSVIGNCLYELLCYRYPLWQMEPNGLPAAMIPILLLILIGMPLSTWVYLSLYPSGGGWLAQARHILAFTAVFILLEFVSVKCGSITYHNGWHLGWSLLFNIFMFIMLRIHFLKPLTGLVLSAAYTLLLMSLFHVSLDKMK